MPHPDRSPAAAPRRFLVTTAAGLESLLMEELAEFGLAPQPTPAGALVLNGDWAAAARLLTRSRIASRLLLSVREFSAGHAAMLYDQVRRIDWPKLFPPERSIAIRAYGTTQGTDYTLNFAPLKIKDAICDEFRYSGLPRPDVDRTDPDVRLTAFFHGGRCELSIDLSGTPLHRRGYREEGAAAPLRENRAAALLRFAGYDGRVPFVDPFCGSGTIVIEAALIALRRAPGLLRPLERFAAAALFPDSVEPLRRERDAAASERLDRTPHPIAGSDVSEPALVVARGNAVKAGVADAVRFDRRDALQLETAGGAIVSNPPFGERLSDTESAITLVREFVHRVKHHATGSTLALMLPRGDLEKAVGLKPARRLAVESGPLGLRFLRFDVYPGSRRGPRAGEPGQ